MACRRLRSPVGRMKLSAISSLAAVSPPDGTIGSTLPVPVSDDQSQPGPKLPVGTAWLTPRSVNVFGLGNDSEFKRPSQTASGVTRVDQLRWARFQKSV